MPWGGIIGLRNSQNTTLNFLDMLCSVRQSNFNPGERLPWADGAEGMPGLAGIVGLGWLQKVRIARVSL